MELREEIYAAYLEIEEDINEVGNRISRNAFNTHKQLQTSR